MHNGRSASVKGAALLALFSSLSAAHACLNVTGTSYEGEAVTTHASGAALQLREYMRRDHRQEGQTMLVALADSTNFNERSDYAVGLVFVGRTKEALEILQKLEREKPGSYFVAANLGTTFELLGNNEEALRWIREGIRRNPGSHEGTEWLHAKFWKRK